MRLLLDSNVLFWSIFERRRLTPRVLALLEDDRNELLVSQASLWELSIKVAKGKLPMPGVTIRYVLDQIEKTGIIILPITVAHILRTETLPHHHRDPFDRMIVAQAIEDGLALLSADRDIASYAAEVIWK